MSEKNKKYVPLHDRIKKSSEVNETLLSEMKAEDDELNDLYRSVFSTPQGDLLLSHLTDKYVGTMPQKNATPNEIMFAAGERYIVLEILNRMKRK